MQVAGKKPKRIVSRGQYLCRVAQKFVLSSFGGISVLFGIAGIGLCVAFVTWVMVSVGGYEDTNKAMAALLLTVTVSAISLWLTWRGCAAMQRAAKLEPVQPLTRHNRSELTAEESLVRSAQEPIAGQQAVLLRSVRDPHCDDDRQLLRVGVLERAEDARLRR